MLIVNWQLKNQATLNGCHAFEAKFQAFLATALIEELLKMGTQLKLLLKYLLCIKRIKWCYYTNLLFFVFFKDHKNISKATVLIRTNVTNWYPRHNKPVPVYQSLWLVKQECMDLDTPTMWKILPSADNRLPFTEVHMQLAETIFLDTNISGTFGRASKGLLLTCCTLPLSIYGWDLEMQDVFLDMCFHT